MSDNNGKFILGVLAGLAAGAVLGILFAPDKGSETRKKIIKKGEEATDEIKDKFNELIDDLNEKIRSAKAQAKNASDNVK